MGGCASHVSCWIVSGGVLNVYIDYVTNNMSYFIIEEQQI